MSMAVLRAMSRRAPAGIIGRIRPSWTEPAVRKWCCLKAPVTWLTASGPGGINGAIRTNYITVTGSSRPLLVNGAGFSGGLFQFTVSGTVGRSITVEGSTNLATWSALATLPNQTGVVQFQDTNSTQICYRFYRAAVPQ